MTTSQPTPFLSEILSGEQIPVGKLAYFRARLSNRIHELVLSEFVKLEREGKINRAELARRIGRKPEQVTRWLGAAGNWTIETLSDLALGMGCEPACSLISLSDAQRQVERIPVFIGTSKGQVTDSSLQTNAATAALSAQNVSLETGGALAAADTKAERNRLGSQRSLDRYLLAA